MIMSSSYRNSLVKRVPELDIAGRHLAGDLVPLAVGRNCPTDHIVAGNRAFTETGVPRLVVRPVNRP